MDSCPHTHARTQTHTSTHSHTHQPFWHKTHPGFLVGAIARDSYKSVPKRRFSFLFPGARGREQRKEEWMSHFELLTYCKCGTLISLQPPPNTGPRSERNNEVWSDQLMLPPSLCPWEAATSVVWWRKSQTGRCPQISTLPPIPGIRLVLGTQFTQHTSLSSCCESGARLARVSVITVTPASGGEDLLDSAKGPALISNLWSTGRNLPLTFGMFFFALKKKSREASRFLFLDRN